MHMTHPSSCSCSRPILLPQTYSHGEQKNTLPVIDVSNVSFAYGNRDVLTNVSLQVTAGDFLAIIGPNGGGKTTLIKLLLGLLSPAKGSINILGHDPRRTRPAVGYVPQHAQTQTCFPITVQEVTLLGLRRSKKNFWSTLWPGYLQEEKSRALDTLALVDMADLAHQRFDALSGGQKQRVLVARALISNPALLLFDEPTSNIDPQGKICLFDLLSTLSRSITIVMVSHDLISASTRITSMAAVNKTLIQSPGRELTPAMLELIYGSHDTSCPLDEYIRGVSDIFSNQTNSKRHD